MLYPVAIETGNENSAFGVVFPDVPSCFSAGDTLDEALAQAKEALDMHFEALSELGELPPQPSKVNELKDNPEYAGWVWAVIEIDVEPFMGKATKLNVTLPDLLTHKIDSVVNTNHAYKSRSHFLQVAAANELQKAMA